MSNVIDFLERMGKDAQLRRASPDEVALALTEADVETPLCSAIVARDTPALQALLKQGVFFATQMPSREDEESEPLDEEEENQPEDDEKPSARSDRRIVATVG
jgi:hypothetical protein